MDENPYQPPEAPPSSVSRGLVVVAMLVGFLALAFGFYGMFVQYSFGTMLIEDGNFRTMRGLTNEQWDAIDAGVQSGVIVVGAPLLVSALAFLAAACLKRF